MRNTYIFALVLLISLSFISAVPQIPVVFSGTVSYSGNPSLSLQGQEINVSIGVGNWKVGTVGANNQFEIAVDPMGVAGDISFYIGGIQTVEKGTYSMGAFIFKDLTINQLPSGVINYYCGDNICNSGESCSSCSTDCGSCSSESSSSSSSRSSSSSSSNTIIVLSNDDSEDKQQIISNSDTSGERLASRKDNSFIELITSGKLLIALFVIVIVLATIVFSMHKKS